MQAQWTWAVPSLFVFVRVYVKLLGTNFKDVSEKYEHGNVGTFSST